MQTKYILGLALLFGLLIHFSAYSQTTNCGPANCQLTTTLNFSTGWDETTGSLTSVGQPDPHWRLMNFPPLTAPPSLPVSPPTAHVVSPFQTNWNDIAGSRPLSMVSSASFGPDNANPTQPWRFRRYFCVCEDTEVELNGSIRADDTGALALYDSNGNPLPFSVTLPPAPNVGNFSSGIPFGQALTLAAGNYYFEFSLFNTNGVASGFAVQGQLLSSTNLAVYDEQIGCCASSVITGQKILDQDCDQVFDVGTDQVGAGFLFDLLDNATNTIIATAQSDALGEFEFNNVPPGNYTVRERSAPGWLPLPSTVQVTLGPLDVQNVTFFNCPYMPKVWAGCTYGDVNANPMNDYDEQGLAVAAYGGFFGSNNVRTFTVADIPNSVTDEEQIVSKHWDTATGTLQSGALLNYWSDATVGAYDVDNLHIAPATIPCFTGDFAGVATISRGGSETDVVYAEFSNNGDLLAQLDITSTDGVFNRESVHDLTNTSAGLTWVGTRVTGPPAESQVMIGQIADCNNPISHHVFSFDLASGSVSATGRSIIELSTPLSSYPGAVYAVTGRIDNETYIFLLDASFTVVGNSRYDVDSNPNTREEGIRIRQLGEVLYVVGNVQPVGPTTLPVQRVFMLRVNFAPASGAQQTQQAFIYDFPGGQEVIVDADFNGSNELILTGAKDLPDPLATVGTPDNRKTYLLALDELGNALWSREYPLSEGSAPSDLLLTPIADDINVVGACWTNEQTTTPFVSNQRRFDEMLIRTDRAGFLASSANCQQDITPNVSTPTPFWQDFAADSEPENFQPTLGTNSSVDYFVEEAYCFNGMSGGDIICDSVSLTTRSVASVDSLCCFAVDYVNNSPGPVYELCLSSSVSGFMFSNLVVDPAFTVTVVPPGNQLCLRSATGPTLPTGTITDAIEYCLPGNTGWFALNYLWKDAADNVVCEGLEEIYCEPPIECDFTFEPDCCEVDLFGSATGGTAPYTYDWDILCDNSFTPPDLTGQNVSWAFGAPGTYVICMRVTDAAGVTCERQQSVTVVDHPPTLACPPDRTVPTDPGLCTATINLVSPTPDDDCTTNFNISCSMSGATTGSASTNPVTLNKGITTISCAIEDEKGQAADCQYQIEVVDQEPPVITCPTQLTSTAIFCDGFAQVTLPDPVVSDNCPMVSFTCSHTSGPFPCGTTIVTCTATDMAGNETICTYPVIVDCPCAEVSPGEIDCTDVDEQFAFSFDVNDLNGFGFGSTCTINVGSTQAGVTVSGVSVTPSGGGNYTVTGLVSVAAPPVPTSITLIIDVSCTCPDGSVNECSFTRTLATPCCKSVTVESQEVCKTGGPVQIPLLGCSALYDVQQVRWYVTDGPCPPGSWPPPLQVTNGCADLTLSPQFHAGNQVCVYAEVDLGPDDGPCTMLISNTATIDLCTPVDCSISSDQSYCWTGSPITPTALSINVDPTRCLDSIRWYDPQGNLIPSANDQQTYQPPALNFTLTPDDCNQLYIYRVEVTNVCGTQTCMATIRLDNEAAPVGDLVLLPPDTNPLCYGEDAILEYTPQCAGPPPRWNWFERTATTTYLPLAWNGDRNPTYRTNRLYEDTWVKVERTNGVCPTDEVEFLLDIIDPVAITSFTATYDDVCAPTQVTLSVDVTPNPADPGCGYNIEWYRNGQLLSTATAAPLTPAFFNYTGSPLPGNYYCIVENTCCPGRFRSPVVTLYPPMEAFIAGPCFRCECDTVTLNSVVLNPLGTCTYQWYTNGTLIVQGTQPSLTVDPRWGGPFRLEVTCTDGTNTCVSTDVFDLRQCGDIDCIVGWEDLPLLTANIFPNPTQDRVVITLAEVAYLPEIEVLDAQGRVVLQGRYGAAQQRYELDLRALPDGLYFVRGISEAGQLLIEQLVKQ
ncbi:MAG: T9SS type A sorting domain-containing protein [Bacteroidota bacterium]